MSGVKSLIDPEKGLFVTESHYALDIIEDLQYDSIYHEHLRFFLIKPLEVLMSLYGFKIIDAVRIPNYGGSIRIISTLNQKLKQKSSVKRLYNLERRKRILH